MHNPIDEYYLKQEEPTKSCLMALREVIKSFDPNITEAWKYSMPMYYYRKKMFCYLWTDKKTDEPYIGIVEGRNIDHPVLEQGNRSRMKILRINPMEDIPVQLISEILNEARKIYDARNKQILL